MVRYGCKARRVHLLTPCKEIARERERQMAGEGWSLAHDDTHANGEMAAAAAASPRYSNEGRYGW